MPHAIRGMSKTLQQMYPDDLGEDIADEIARYYYVLNTNEKTHVMTNLHNARRNAYVYIAFPNVRLALGIYLAILISNAEGEWSFSGLKGIRIIWPYTCVIQSRNYFPCPQTIKLHKNSKYLKFDFICSPRWRNAICVF